MRSTAGRIMDRFMWPHLALMALVLLANGCHAQVSAPTVSPKSPMSVNPGVTSPQPITITFTDGAKPSASVFTTTVSNPVYTAPLAGQFNDAKLQFSIAAITSKAAGNTVTYTATVSVLPSAIFGTAASMSASFTITINKDLVGAVVSVPYVVTVNRVAPKAPVFLTNTGSAVNPTTVLVPSGALFTYSVLAQDFNSAPTLTFATTSSVVGTPTGLSTSTPSNVTTNVDGMCNTFTSVVAFLAPTKLVGDLPTTATLRTVATTLSNARVAAATATWSVTATFNPPVAQPPTITINTPLYASTTAAAPLLLGQGQTVTIAVTVSDPNNRIQTPLTLQATVGNGYILTQQTWANLGNNTGVSVSVKAPIGFSVATLNLVLTNAAKKSTTVVIYLQTSDYSAPKITTKPASLTLVSGQGYLDWNATDTNGIPQTPLTWTITQIFSNPSTDLNLAHLTNGIVFQDLPVTFADGTSGINETGRFFFDPIVEPTDLTITPIKGTVDLLVTVTNQAGLSDQYRTSSIPAQVNAGADAIVFQGAECRTDPKVPGNCKKLLLNVHDSLVDAPPGTGAIVVSLRPYMTSATDSSGLHVLYDPFTDPNQLFGGTFDYLGAGAYTLSLVDVPIPWCMQDGSVPTTLPAACEVATMVAVSNHNGISDIYPATFT